MKLHLYHECVFCKIVTCHHCVISHHPGLVAKRETLLFVHDTATDVTAATKSDVERLLTDVCETSRYAATTSSPRQFSQLVSAMKGLSHRDLQAVYTQLSTGGLCDDNEKTL